VARPMPLLLAAPEITAVLPLSSMRSSSPDPVPDRGEEVALRLLHPQTRKARRRAVSGGENDA
jgi:hypothetical protein